MVRIAPTNDRSVVGVMNEFAFQGEYLWKEGFEDLEALSHRMASLILGPLHHRSGSPDRELAAVVGAAEPLATVIAFPSRPAAADPQPTASSKAARRCWPRWPTCRRQAAFGTVTDRAHPPG